MVLVVNLNTTIDKTYIINDFKINKIFRPKKEISVGGGKGVNVARVLNYFNIKNSVIGFVGGYNKSFILSSFKKEKIKFIPITVNGNSRVCTIIVDLKNHTETVINENGPTISDVETNAFFKRFNKEVKKVRILVISGSVPPGVPANIYYELINIAKKYKIITILDTSKDALLEGIKAKPDILKVNENEIKYAFEKMKLRNILKILKERGIKFPILTRGKKGAVYIDETDRIRIEKVFKIRKISTIGSGDAFTAGIVKGIIENKRLSDCVRIANKLAALNALTLGAGNIRDY